MAFDFGNANEAQRSAISTTDGPLLIIAGPGTGKTYTLVKRIVYLITEKNVLPEEIMIATIIKRRIVAQTIKNNRLLSFIDYNPFV